MQTVRLDRRCAARSPGRLVWRLYDFVDRWSHGSLCRSLFRAAANNLLLLECSSDAAGSFRTEVGFTHLDRSEPYIRHSPSSYVADMHTPMLLIHSEDDLRCPISQAEELSSGCVCSGGTQS